MTAPKLLLGVGVPAAVLALAIVPWAVAWTDLPDPIATHFAGNGAADGSAPRWVSVLVHAAVAVVTAAMLARAARHPAASVPGQVGVATFVGVLFGVIAVALASVNHGVDDWHEAQLGAGWVAGGIGAALGAALGSMALASVLVPQSGERAHVGTRGMELRTGERVVWFGAARSSGLVVVAAANAVIGVAVLVLTSAVGTGLTLLFVGVMLAAFASVHVLVSADGVVVRTGTLPWPAVRIGMDDIVDATVGDIRPMAWGGWGYRGSLRLFGQAGWVVRAGPALVLHLAGRKRFTVTVDGADEGAAVVAALRSRRP